MDQLDRTIITIVGRFPQTTSCYLESDFLQYDLRFAGLLVDTGRNLIASFCHLHEDIIQIVIVLMQEMAMHVAKD